MHSVLDMMAGGAAFGVALAVLGKLSRWSHARFQRKVRAARARGDMRMRL